MLKTTIMNNCVDSLTVS